MTIEQDVLPRKLGRRVVTAGVEVERLCKEFRGGLRL